jgi:hypothetical protein
LPIFNEDVAVNTTDGKQMIRLDVNKPTPGLITPRSDERIRIDANVPSIVVRGPNDKLSIVLNGDTANATFANADGQNTVRIDGGKADLTLGGAGQTANVVLRNGDGYDVVTVHAGGRMMLGNVTGKRRISLDGPEANLWLGGQGEAGDVMLFDKDEENNNNQSQATVWISGQNGDIVLRNADCAEEFDIAHVAGVEPGAVMVIGAEDVLELGSEAYDKRVVGVVSGAGDLRPGIVLGRQSSSQNRLPIALTGKVFCKVDARYAPIAVGDLLTTSRTPGHAMKAVDNARAFGAVIGKALRAQAADTGLIPVLIALQ